MIGVLIWSNNILGYDVYMGKGYVECVDNCKVSLSLSLENASILTNIEYINIQDNSYYEFDYELSDIEIDLENNLNYQILTFNGLDDRLNNRTIQDIKIFYNKEKLFKKIISMFFE